MFETERTDNKAYSQGRDFLSNRTLFRSVWKGILILWIVLLPLKIMRAREENSFWADEIYSVIMAKRPVKEILYYDAQHDNFYFLILKIWMGIGRLFLWFPNLFWTRLLNVIQWMLFSVIVWLGSRRLLGNFQGSILSWAVLSGAMVAYITKEIRSYALPSFALFICFLIIVMLWKNIQENRAGSNRVPSSVLPVGFRFGYILCALAAVYFNFLGALLLITMTIAWFFLYIQQKKRTSPIYIQGILMHVLIGILYIPWILLIMGNLTDIQSQNRSWMTPCTIGNFLRVFFFWFPYGQVSVSKSVFFSMVLYIVGISSVFLPWGFVLWGGLFHKPGIDEEPFLLKTGLLASIISIYYVLLLFLLNSFAGIKIFHGPRYPSIVVPIWTWGLVAAALWARQRMKLRLVYVLIILIPWFMASFFGQLWVHSLEARNGLQQWRKESGDWLPEPGADLYVFPAELIPYFPKNLGHYNIKTMDELGGVSRDIRNVFVLDLNNWVTIRSSHEEMIMKLISSNRLSHGFVIKEYSPRFSPFRNYILLDYKHEAARKILKNGIRSSPENIPSNAKALALPEDQKSYEGWAILELGKDNCFFRWGLGESSILRFNRSLEPGDYIVHIFAYRQPYPESQALMKFRFRAEKNEVSILQGEGSIHIRIPVRLTRKHRFPCLIIQQSSWCPSDYIEGSPDGRSLTFLFSHAWIE